MDIVLLANMLTLIAQLVSFYASTRKSKNQVLFFQNVFMLIISVASYLLKGYSAIVTNVVCVIRNCLSMKGIGSRWITYGLIVFTVVFGTAVNRNGFLGYLPIIANIIQTLAVLDEKADVRRVKISFGIACLLWTAFNWSIQSYVGSFFNLFNGISYLINGLKETANK